MDVVEAFGARLKELREAAGLTQVQLAEKAELHPQGIIKLERGERKPAWETVIALAKALDVTCDAFQQLPASYSEPKVGRPRKEPEPEKPTRKRPLSPRQHRGDGDGPGRGSDR
jgi:transcriptional regulator with XRE-family HTH domain